MRKTTKLVLALLLVGGSVSLTSCKDYTEENDIETRLDFQAQLKELQKAQQQQLETLEQKLNDMAADLEGNVSVETDAATGKNYLVVGGTKYELCPGQDHNVSINGDEITITDASGNTWTFDKSAIGTGANCNCSFTYDSAKKVYVLTNGSQTLEIPAGSSCSVVDNGETVTYTVDGKSVTVAKPKSEVSVSTNAAGQQVLSIQKYVNGAASGAPVEVVIPADLTPEVTSIFTALYGANGTAAAPEAGSLVARVAAAEAAIDAVEAELTQVKNDLDAVEADLVKVTDRVSALEIKVAQIVGDLSKVSNALKKLVTGVIVQDVQNPVFGSYSSLLTNVQTQILIAQHGEIGNAVDFPSVDPMESYFPGDATIGEAGMVYATVNPNTVDFSGIDFELVNSADKASAIKLQPGVKTGEDDVLNFGLTRSAADNGLYKFKAVLPEADVNDSKLAMSMPAAEVKSLASDLLNVKLSSPSSVKPVVSDMAKLAQEMMSQMKKERLGIKCAWTDSLGEHKVYSQYNIAAVAYQPLGFYTVDGIFKKGGAYWRGYDKAKSLIDNAAKTAGRQISQQINNTLGLANISADLTNISTKLNHIDKIEFDSNKKIIVTTDVTIPEQTVVVPAKTQQVQVTIPSKDITVTVPATNVPFAEQKIEVDVPINTTTEVQYSYEVPNSYDKVNDIFTYETKTGKTTVTINKTEKVTVTVPAQTVVAPGQTITVPTGDITTTVNVPIPEQSVKVGPFTQTVTIDITDQVNGIFGDMLTDVNNNFDDVNKLIDALNELMIDANDMIDNINKMQQKLENATYMTSVHKMLDKIANAVGKYTPMLFKPALFMNSDSGFGVVGTYGVPSTVASTQVTLIPTTYSAELLSSIYKKYIRVNDGQGQILDNDQKTVTVNLKKGLNKIEYYALDFQGNQYPQAGNESAAEYYIYVK